MQSLQAAEQADPRLAQRLCLALGFFDIFLGGFAVFYPQVWGKIFHPHLTEIPTEYIVRTGLLWLFFCLVQFRAGLGRVAGRWLLVVAVLRLMEVPADLAYAVLLQGGAWWSRALILTAPPVNAAIGAYLWRVSRKIGW